MYMNGIASAGEILSLGVQHGVVYKVGGIFTFRGVKLGSDQESVNKRLKEDNLLCAAIERAIRQRSVPAVI